ncbi:MAG: exonuclease subunit SbcD [Myxococcota bacterium]|jgi:exonuclease SbcD|nr:exonuclease subunit SbcD [Myxococcota bacterium]
MPLRCLHTADWHLGAELKGVSRLEEQERFLQWLLEVIEEERIEVLLIAGDVFEHAHPSATSQTAYYRFLASLPKRLRATIVIAGNHDSALRLEAPKEILESLRIHVVGELPKEREQCLINIDEQLVVAAVPYVSEYRLGVRITGSSSTEVASRSQRAFQQLYTELAELAEERFPDAALVAMGHLPCAAPGVAHRHQYRPVFLQGALPTSIFDERYCYVALGHLHQAHTPDGHRVHYPGSPLQLNYSELDHDPQVICFEVDQGKLLGAGYRWLQVPRFRSLLELEGTRQELEIQLESLQWPEQQLPPILYLKLDEAPAERSQPLALLRDFDELRRAIRPELNIAACKLKELVQTQPQAPAPDLSQPREVFRLLYQHKKGSEPSEQLMALFDQAEASAKQCS